MIFHRLHQIIILLIYLSLSATSYGYTFEHKIENYGLTFAAHTVDQDHRTSLILTYIIHSGFISGYQNRYGDNLKPPTNVYHRMTA